jgi:glyoxylase-like metal-dependent hydrolase (beta-lactamase superfamily II)
MEFNGPIYQTKIQLTPEIPLHVYLIKGSNYAVWIDSGIKSMLPQLVETMTDAEVRNSDLRFILHTHSHHDHIGSNAQIQDKTGCLIAAPAYYAAWHADFETHYQEFARAFPNLMPDTPELRNEALSILDEPRPLDLITDEGSQFNLGGGVSLRAYSFPGHMMAELGWFEASTSTLILGDAITGLAWPLFHGHLTVKGYRSTLAKIRTLMPELGVRQVLFAHFPPKIPSEVEKLLDQAAAYIDEIEVTLLRLLAGSDTVTLETLWKETCSRLERIQEFRSLSMVAAHMVDLTERGIVREVTTQTYTLR